MATGPLGETNDLLPLVQEGMTVIDADGNKVGTVRQVYLGGEDLSERPPDEDLGYVAASLDSPVAGVPAGLQGRLALTGFVEIATGIFQANCYATPDQLAQIDSDGVTLAVGKDGLARK